MNNIWEDLIHGVTKKDVRSMARLITRVENREPGWIAAMAEIYPLAGSARVFGITGSPGAGKSTLTCEITRALTERGFSVGIIAVDPSSPFSGGALLGDRLRMQSIFTMERVYIRSMATRGSLGGLCQAARDVVRIMDAFGKDIVLVETVGVGQDEIEIVRAADRVMLILVPGQGDGIQAIKAGVMEIADIYVVNKADRQGADEVAADVTGMLSLSESQKDYLPPVLQVSALKKQGIRELVDTLLSTPLDERKQRLKKEIRIREEILSLVEREVFWQVRRDMLRNGRIGRAVEQIMENKADPYTIVNQMFAEDQSMQFMRIVEHDNDEKRKNRSGKTG
ncbi:MAG: methylmalonyl Co-A mutase-associated GTPase MeaB [Desulfosalsimonadaceae bacterium]